MFQGRKNKTKSALYYQVYNEVYCGGMKPEEYLQVLLAENGLTDLHSIQKCDIIYERKESTI